MMKHNTTFLKRCLALALALVLVVSGSNLGWALRAFAVEGDDVSVNVGTVVAGNYDLTDAEKALLSSGLLVGGTITVDALSGDKVTVDSEAKTITAKKDGEWIPVSATIKVGEEVKETIPLTAGEAAAYTYEGKAFSVEVTYEVYGDVNANDQATLLQAPAYLKTGVDNLGTIASNAGSLALYYMFNDALVMLADGIEYSYGGFMNVNIQFESEEAVAAAKALAGQLDTANGDNNLDLQDMANARNSTVAAKYLVENGAAMKAKAGETYNYINAIVNDGIFDADSLKMEALKEYDVTTYNLVNNFKTSMTVWLNAMTAVCADTWPEGYVNPVKDGLTDAQYATLGELVNALGTVNSIETTKNPLVVATDVVRCNMSMYDVAVNVQMMVVADVADSAELVAYGKVASTSVTLEAGTTKAEIEAAVAASGIVGLATSAWTAYSEEHYVATYSELPEALSEDTSYSITFVPKNYTVSSNYADDVAVPYGYRMTLPVNSSADKVYDYKVNGQYYAQGSEVKILGDTNIVRTEGAVREDNTLLALVLKLDDELTSAEKAILENKAVNAGSNVISIRYPGEGVVSLDEVNDVVTAEEVLSDYPEKELYWVPVSAAVSYNGELLNTYDMVKNGSAWSAEIKETRYTQVVVTYELDLVDQDVQALKNVPYILVSEAKTQVAQLANLCAEKPSLEKVMKPVIQLIKDNNYATDPATKAALDAVFNDGYDSNNYLKLYNYVTTIESLETNALKLAYLYQNYDALNSELVFLRDCLVTIASDKEFLDTVAANLPAYAEDINRIVEIGDRLESMKLQAPNAAIDVNSSALNALTELLVGSTVNEYTAAETLKLQHSISVTASDSVNVKVTLKKGETSVTIEQSAIKGEKLNAASFQADFEKAYNKLNISEAFAKHSNDAENKAEFAKILEASYDQDTAFELVWTANEYEIEFTCNGETIVFGTVNVDDTYITLPAHADSAMAYVYTVNGVEYAQGTSYKVDLDNLDTLVITWTTYNVAEKESADRFNAFVETLNQSQSGITFVVDGDTLTMVVDAAATKDELMASAEKLFLAIANYNVIGLNNEVFYENAQFSIQTLINAVLNDANFNNAGVASAVINGTPVLTATMQLGTSAVDVDRELTFYVKVVNANDKMVKAANALNSADRFVSFQSNNGELDVDVRLPEKIYEIYLTALLAAGEVDTNDMNAVNNEIAFMFLYDYVNMVLGNDAITTQTFQNTLEILDKATNLVGKDIPDYDLTQYEGAYQVLKAIYNNIDIVVEGEAPVSITGNATASALNQAIAAAGIDTQKYSLYLGMIKELNADNQGVVLTATVNASLVNSAVDFEALVIDLDEGVQGAKDAKDAVQNGGIVEEVKENVKGEGLANSIDYTTNLTGRVSEITGAAAIYLLSDVNGDLVINHTTILDLNGCTINGNITVNGGELYIVDSRVANSDCGGVTGTITGDVNIIAGHYNVDVSAFLKDGYKQVNGSVQNALYTIEREGSDFILVLNSDFMEDACVEGYLPSVKYLAAEIAVDMVLNLYIPANLNADGNRIYGIDDRFNDLIGLVKNDLSVGDLVDLGLECVDVKGIAAFANAILADMLQFGEIADAIEQEKAIASYTYETNPWAVEIMHAAEGDYMTFGIVANDEVSKDVTLSVKVVGDNIKKLVALLRELDNIVVYEETGASVDLEQPVRDGKTIVLEGGAQASLSLDLTVHGDDEYDKDDYKNILAVIFAYGNPDKAETLVNAIGDNEALNAAFNDMTVREIIASLDAMSRSVSFAKMAESVGAADLISDSADDLESLYHLIACGAGKLLAKLESMNMDEVVDSVEDAAEKALAKLELTTLQPIVDKAGNVIERILAKVDLDSKLGALDQGDGTYLLYYAYSTSGNVDYRGYGADLTLTETSGMLKVKIFEQEEEEVDDCLWGDANHDNEVNAKDATLVLQYSAGTIAEDQFFCTIRTDVNGDGEINAKDATLILQHSAGTITKFPVEE